MCQLRHPNIVSADDVYFSTDIAPSANASSAARAQDVFVRMPYYPADLAWLIHSSPQVLTSAHIQVRQCLHQRQRRSFCAHSRTFLLRRSTFWFKCCAACGDCRSRCASHARPLDVRCRYLHACGVIHRDLKPSNMWASALCADMLRSGCFVLFPLIRPELQTCGRALRRAHLRF